MEINKEKLFHVRKVLIDNVFRNPTIMLSDEVRGYNEDDIDLIEVITDLYEYLHILLTGERYDYMFHWANKAGSWVDTGNFDKLVKEDMEKFKL